MKYINLIMTEKCNMRCKYCYEGEKGNRSIAWEKIDQYLKFIYKYCKYDKEVYVNFHGGEPLIEFEKISYLVSNIHKYYPTTCYSMTTNGALLSSEIIKWIKVENVNISISLDGNEKINNLMRKDVKGDGTFHSVYANALFYMKEVSQPRIRMTIVPQSVKFLFDSVMFLLNSGFCNIVAVPDLFSNSWDDDMIKDLENELIRVYSALTKDKWNEFVFWSELQPHKRGRCFGGVQELTIDCFGNIFPCLYSLGDCNLVIGNIETGLNKERIMDLHAMCLKDNLECYSCSNKEYCISNRCKFVNYQLCKRYNHASVIICEIENLMNRIRNKFL